MLRSGTSISDKIDLFQYISKSWKSQLNENIDIGQRINEQYEVLTVIGKGGTGQTYLAGRLDSDIKVVLKVLTFSEMKEWKVLELFEREVKLLANMNHPFIPKYIDHFAIEYDNDVQYFLVQEYIKGANLEQIIRSGKRLSLEQVNFIFKSLLAVLSYIHDLQPSVIHRDIKPKNIILSENCQVYLVDFGAAGQIVKDTMMGGSTFVGTIAYMPHEQLYAKVYPASDLYALALTIIFLITGKEPSEFNLKGLKIDYHPFVNIPDNIKQLLDQMIEPDPQLRISSAKEALDLLLKKTPTVLTDEEFIQQLWPQYTNLTEEERMKQTQLQYTKPLQTEKMAESLIEKEKWLIEDKLTWGGIFSIVILLLIVFGILFFTRILKTSSALDLYSVVIIFLTICCVMIIKRIK